MTSRLATAASAYLKSAAHQPVEWYPWGDEAFERARAEDKPVLLDIGAVWCHWCHVMDGESYEDPAIAELLNRDWICIKVDRDERPDVDARFQRAVNVISGQGGWPLTAFMTPDGQVFFGGTYFPPEGRGGRPGFASVLTELARVYREDRTRVGEQAGTIRRHIEQLGRDGTSGELDPAVVSGAADAMARVFDFRYGGFGSQPKFPHPTACEFLLGRAVDTGEPWPHEMVERTLTAMARGGIHDHVGGGFHRYSVDARWIVPHFEKMSYDNSELLRTYVYAASLATDDALPVFHDVIEGIVHWVMTVMGDPDGGYYASQDADVGLDDDGDYFTWTPDEARAAVSGRQFAALERRYDIDDVGEMHHNPQKNVLWVKQSPTEIAAALEAPLDEVHGLLAAGLEGLATARGQRPTPFVDRTRYTGWNAMMASAMLTAGAYLNRPDVDQHALRTLELLFRAAVGEDGAVAHAIDGDVGDLLDDHVQLANASVAAYEATGDRQWVDRASVIMEHVWSRFRAADGGLLDRQADGDDGMLADPIKPFHDSPTPSPNGIAAIVLARLAEHTGLEPWRARLQEHLTAFAGELTEIGLHGAAMLVGADWHFAPATHLVVVPSDDDEGRALLRVARAAYRPRKVLTILPPGTDLEGLPAPVRAAMDGATPRAYVCVGTRCAPPCSSAAELHTLLRNR